MRRGSKRTSGKRISGLPPLFSPSTPALLPPSSLSSPSPLTLPQRIPLTGSRDLVFVDSSGALMGMGGHGLRLQIGVLPSSVGAYTWLFSCTAGVVRSAGVDCTNDCWSSLVSSLLTSHLLYPIANPLLLPFPQPPPIRRPRPTEFKGRSLARTSFAKVTHTEHTKRKTVTLFDIVYTLKRSSLTLHRG
ncbi:hypothetical protein B0H12DRAFT_1246144 [Mycena haematopus]|nr:hypothetical protein B0H12DRAFT_1246144 [Mycena haematopus]